MMKKKVLIFATMLLFSSMAFAVTDVDFTLVATGAGTVEWVTDAPADEVGDWSVKLENTAAASYSAVEFVPEGTVTLADFQIDITNGTPAYSFKYLFDHSLNGPQFELTFEESGGTGWLEITAVGLQGATASSSWQTEALAGATLAGYGGNTPDGSSVFNWGPLTALSGIEAAVNASFDTAEDGVSASSYVLTKVQVELWEDEAKVCYVDDIIINGTTYSVDDPVMNTRLSETYVSIQAAIDAATAGDDIQLPAGTYDSESFPITISVEVSLLGPNEGIDPNTGTRVTEATILGDIDREVITVQADNVLIDGVTIQNDFNSSQNGDGVLINYNTTGATVQNNIITLNTSYGVWGVMLAYDDASPTLIVTDATVSNNKFTGFWGGVYVQGCALNTDISDNVMTDVKEGINLGGGTTADKTKSTSITGNTITGSAMYGISIEECEQSTQDLYEDLLIENNTITGSTLNGIHIYANCGLITGLVINYNNISGNTNYGIQNLNGVGYNAKYNWWGDVTGPTNATSNPYGTGNDVSDDVTYVPWLDAAYPGGGATGGIPVELTIISDPTVQVGEVVTIGDTLKDVNGNLIDDEVIDYSLVGVGNILSTSETTDDTGYTSVDYLAGYLPGTATVRAELRSDTTINATVTITVGVGPVAEVVVTPESDSVVVLDDVTIVAELLDAYENHIDADTSKISFTGGAGIKGVKSVTADKKIQIVYTTDSTKTGLVTPEVITATYLSTSITDVADIYTAGDQVAPDSLTVTFAGDLINVSDDSTGGTTFNVEAKDQHGNLTENRRITFVASYGALESVDTTNADGVFASDLEYYGGAEAQVVILTATATEGGATGKDTLYLKAVATDSILITCPKTSVVAGEEVTLTFTYFDEFENETEELSPVFSNISALAALGATVKDTIEDNILILNRAKVYGVLLTKTYTVSDTITATYVDTIVATVGSVVDTFFMNLTSSGVLYSFDIVIDNDSVATTDDMTFTITAKDPGGNRKYDYEGDVLIELIGSSADSVNWTGDVDTCLSDEFEFVAEDAFVDGALELTLKNRWAESGLTFSVTDTATDIAADTTGFDFYPGDVDSLALTLGSDDIYAGQEFTCTVTPVDIYDNTNSTDEVNFYMTAKEPEVLAVASNKRFIIGPETYTLTASGASIDQYLRYYDAKLGDDPLTAPIGQVSFVVKAADVTDPVITLTSPTADTVLALADLPLPVAGTASDLSTFTLTVNGDTVDVAADSTFATTLAFADFEGDTTVVVYAVDAVDNESTITVAIKIDTTGPALANMAPVDSTRLREPVTDVCFSATDALSGVDTTTAVLTFDGIVVETEITEPVDGGYKFTYTTDSLANGWYTYSVEVKDMAGNVIKDSAVFEIDLNMLGDVDFDDAITTIDANMVLEYAVGLHASWDGTDTVEVADVTGDGAVGAYDAAQIFKYALGVDSTFAPL
ncbi:MAG: right-handed parallel beta-helix repeat-containing protein, partial [Candidatus Marinimicrobia bacterium]|nr:right-handed parallel beta-helix repeat-containing protein [Candidatus Neomarinimicrobiota bacterium]